MGDGSARRSWELDGPAGPRRAPSAPRCQRSARTRIEKLEVRESLATLSVSVLCVVFLLISPALGAVSWCTIEVGVFDGDAEAVEGVDVRAVGQYVFEPQSLVTDTKGAVVLVGLPAGTYRLEISREDYQWLEVQDVRCEPNGVVRIVITLERTDGDETVILPSGPSVDPEATTVGCLRSREAWELLPGIGVIDAGNFELTPADSIAEAGIIAAGRSDGPGVGSVVVPRYPEKGSHGRVSLEAGTGVRAQPTGTRGDVTSINDAWRTRFSIGGLPGGSRLGTFFAVEMDTASLENRVAFADRASGESVERSRQWDQDSVMAYGVLDWMPTSNNRVALRLNAGRTRDRDIASSLFVTPDQPIPGGDRDHKAGEVGLEWNSLVSDVLAVRIAGRYSDDTREWIPTNTGLIEQDQSPDGDWTGGLGNGVWGGDGGVAGFEEGIEDFHGEFDLEWVAGSGHRLGIEGSWRREDRDLRYSNGGGGEGLGTRRTYRGPVAERRDSLTPPELSRGLLDSGRILLRDAWRAAPDVTVILGLEIVDLRFDPGADRTGYHFGAADTLSPRIGIVWDFEGTGRSRAWVRWARFRQGPSEAVRWRLTGALDTETLFVDDDGSQGARQAGPIAVAPDLEPVQIDETVFGAEYEVLSHLVVGAAGAIRQTRGGLSVVTEDGGLTMELTTPVGDVWSERLDNNVLEAWGWIRKRLANGWQAGVLLGWLQSQGAWPGAQDLDMADLDREYLADVLSPAALEGAWGPLPDDRRWHLSASGSWRFAAGPSLGGRLTYRSGAPVSRVGALADGLGLDRRFVGSRGSAGRTPELWRLDVIGSWPFEVGEGELEAFVDLSNLLNQQRAVSSDERWTVLDEVQSAGLNPDEQRTAGTWGQPLVVQPPLELRVGLTYRW